MIKVETYSVEIVESFSVPREVILDAIESNRDPDCRAGFNKIYAIKDLRNWFDDQYGRRLNLKDAKDLIEREG